MVPVACRAQKKSGETITLAPSENFVLTGVISLPGRFAVGEPQPHR